MKTFTILTLAIALLPISSAQADLWVQKSWEGGRGQSFWVDTTGYLAGWSEDGASVPGELVLRCPGWDATDLPEGLYIRRLLRAADGSLYAGEYEGSVFRSTDAGVTWSKFGSLPNGVYVDDMMQSSSSGHPFYVIYSGVVWKSFDACTTWFQTGAMPMNVNFLAAIMEAGSTIYIGGHMYGRPFHEGQVFKSTNWGATWDTTAWPPIGFCTVRCLLRGIDGRIYAGGSEGGCVLRTTNGGLSWQGDFLVGPMCVYEIAQAADSALYAGTNGPEEMGRVWKSTDHGATWWAADSFPLIPQTECVLASSDGSVYAGGNNYSGMGVYRSTDKGGTWLETGDMWDTLGGVAVTLLELPDGTILAGGARAVTAERPCTWRLTKPYGWVTSSVFDAGEVPKYGTIDWSFTTQGDSPVVKVRTDTLLDMSTAPDWDLCPAATNGQDISFLSSVHDGQRYVQYRIEMRGWDNFSTPVFHDISIEYTPTGITEDWRRTWSSLFSLTASPSVFKKQVTVSFSIPESSHLEVTVFDLAGRPVRTLLDEVVSSGEHSLVWDGTDGRGSALSAGVYFCALRSLPGVCGHSVLRKIVYLGR